METENFLLEEKCRNLMIVVIDAIEASGENLCTAVNGVTYDLPQLFGGMLKLKEVELKMIDQMKRAISLGVFRDEPDKLLRLLDGMISARETELEEIDRIQDVVSALLLITGYATGDPSIKEALDYWKNEDRIH